LKAVAPNQIESIEKNLETHHPAATAIRIQSWIKFGYVEIQ
jgi:hypothetical protein